MKQKKKKPGNAWMAHAKRKKLEVWLEPALFDKFGALCKSHYKTRAKVLRKLIEYVSAGGVTAIEILKGVAQDSNRQQAN